VTDVPGGTILDHLYRTAGAAALAGQTDAELLRHVVAGPGATAEAAFTVLLHRHGPLVYRTCRAALRDAHDAEDAFQATFLVLARKARSLRVRGDLGPWLYEVARRVAAHARTAAARRRKHEQQAAAVKAEATDASEPDVASLVHDAVGRLPQRFRAAVVLCDLEGLSYRDAAGRLGWTLATVRNRLARGRQRLRTALQRVGLAPEVVALTAGAAPTVPRALAMATAHAAAQVAAGTGAGGVPESVLTLVTGGLHAMLIAKLKTVGLSMLAAMVLVAGAYGLGAKGPAERPKPSEPSPFAEAQPPPAAPATPAPQAPPMTAEKLVAKLNQIVDVQKEIDNTPLKDVLSFLTDKYGVAFIVNVQAFDRDNANRTVEDSPVRLPRMPGVSLRTLLRYLLAQVQGRVLVRTDHLEVVPVNEAMTVAYGKPPGRYVSEARLDFQLGAPFVNIVSDRQPLERALADIAEQSGRNVVLDSRVNERDKLVVTARLLNTPTDTAVRVLAELCSLKSVPLDNVFVVTTREHAAELQAEEAKTAEAFRREVEETVQHMREQKREQQQSKPNAPPPTP
jgi:RNA polymerase sigma factor (sigma-70 family)